jgi:hypothetical protein
MYVMLELLKLACSWVAVQESLILRMYVFILRDKRNHRFSLLCDTRKKLK